MKKRSGVGSKKKEQGRGQHEFWNGKIGARGVSERKGESVSHGGGVTQTTKKTPESVKNKERDHVDV